jgi:hypothetical protein
MFAGSGTATLRKGGGSGGGSVSVSPLVAKQARSSQKKINKMATQEMDRVCT